MRQPLHFSLDEAERLHGIAYTAALQTGARGEALDELTAEIFTALAAQANGAALKAQAHPALRLIEGS